MALPEAHAASICASATFGSFVSRARLSLDQIRAELAWVNETPDPNKCGCGNLRCCDETGHKPGACASVVATKFWTFRWEYYCHAVSMNGAARKRVATWSRGSRVIDGGLFVPLTTNCLRITLPVLPARCSLPHSMRRLQRDPRRWRCTV